MRNWRRRGVLLAVGAALAIAGLASVWAMGVGSSERQQDTLHNCPATGVWERFGVDGGRCCMARFVVAAERFEPATAGRLPDVGLMSPLRQDWALG